MKKLILTIISCLLLTACTEYTSKKRPLIITNSTTCRSDHSTELGKYYYELNSATDNGGLMVYSDSLWYAGDTLILVKKR